MFGNRQKQLSAQAAEIAALRSELADLKNQLAQPAPVGPIKKASIFVGETEVKIYPLTPEDWASVIEELPTFMFSLITERAASGGMNSTETLNKTMDTAKKWIRASVKDKVDLDMLTVPQSIHAVKIISELNGVDASLSAFFRERTGTQNFGLSGDALQH